jgi:hypothetical protein
MSVLCHWLFICHLYLMSLFFWWGTYRANMLPVIIHSYCIKKQTLKNKRNFKKIDSDSLLNTHDNQEAKSLFPGSLRTGCIRSAAGTCPPEQRSNMTNSTVGCRDWLVWCWICPLHAIKSQAPVDFIAEWTDFVLRGINELPNHRVMYFDGSYTLKGAGASVVLTPSPKGDVLKDTI